YDVLNSEEAKAEAGEKSLLHITKPEIDFEPIIDEHSQAAYDKAVENFRSWRERGWLLQDGGQNYYVYAQTMGSRTQYGLVLCAHIDDYANGTIKKHELTRKDKEDDRMVHVRIQSANIEPVFFAYNESDAIDSVVAKYTATVPEYDFVAADGFGHKFWVVDDEADIQAITRGFSEVDAFYVADGHHRTAAAARVGAERRDGNPNHTGEEEYNWFMAVAFPQNQLRIMDYNRVVRDLNGHTPERVLELVAEDFGIAELGTDADRQVAEGGFAPVKLHDFSMYLDGKWYALTAKPGRCNDDDPIGVLDVTLLSERVLDRILGIKDLRRDKRIDFVGGIRGLGELSRRVDSGEMKIAFALCPVSMKQLIDIADSGNIMPPKTTWFEPKLRSGLAIHLF
ncbi:MAG: DUF1015 domain-containing protein, partial [Candidatus Cryptobacteroides sp.]